MADPTAPLGEPQKAEYYAVVEENAELRATITRLTSQLDAAVEALAGRYHQDGNTPGEDIANVCALYVETEDALPGEDDGWFFDDEDYSLPDAVRRIVAAERRNSERLRAADELRHACLRFLHNNVFLWQCALCGALDRHEPECAVAAYDATEEQK